jgi:hypothetical protein
MEACAFSAAFGEADRPLSKEEVERAARKNAKVEVLKQFMVEKGLL